MTKHAMIWDRARLVHRIARIIADRLPPDFLGDCVRAVAEEGVRLISIDANGIKPEELRELITKEILGREKFVEWVKVRLKSAEEYGAGGRIDAFKEVLAYLKEMP